MAIATARAGNVIGGGDWAVDRIVPDAMRALASEKTIEVRTQEQHVQAACIRTIMDIYYWQKN